MTQYVSRMAKIVISPARAELKQPSSCVKKIRPKRQGDLLTAIRSLATVKILSLTIEPLQAPCNVNTGTRVIKNNQRKAETIRFHRTLISGGRSSGKSLFSAYSATRRLGGRAMLCCGPAHCLA